MKRKSTTLGGAWKFVELSIECTCQTSLCKIIGLMKGFWDKKQIRLDFLVPDNEKITENMTQNVYSKGWHTQYVWAYMLWFAGDNPGLSMFVTGCTQGMLRAYNAPTVSLLFWSPIITKSGF